MAKGSFGLNTGSCFRNGSRHINPPRPLPARGPVPAPFLVYLQSNRRRSVSRGAGRAVLTRRRARNDFFFGVSRARAAAAARRARCAGAGAHEQRACRRADPPPRRTARSSRCRSRRHLENSPASSCTSPQPPPSPAPALPQRPRPSLPTLASPPLQPARPSASPPPTSTFRPLRAHVVHPSSTAYCQPGKLLLPAPSQLLCASHGLHLLMRARKAAPAQARPTCAP